MDNIYVFGPYRLYPAARSLKRDGFDVTMGSRAFDLLVALVLRAGQVVSHRDLISIAWQGLNVEGSNVRVQMANLRRELECGIDGERYVISIPGRGYCFVAAIERLTSDDVVEEVAWPRPSRIAAMGQHVSSAPDASGIKQRQARLPAPHERVFGRIDNIDELARAIAARRLVTVVGPGGIGKTTLAVLVAHVLDGVSHSVSFVDLSCIDHGSLVAPTIASALARSSTSEGSLPELLTFLAEGSQLVILDNCEHVIEDVARLIQLILDNTSNTNILVTSREALRLQGEAIYLLRSLAAPPNTGRLTAKQALSWPAVALFMERAYNGGYHRPLDDNQASIVAAICRRLDGNPLAIGLVASRVGTYGFERVADLLTNQLALHWRGSRNAAPRHQTVEAMLSWSYDLLSDRHRKILRRLSVFAGEFSIDAAVAVAGDDETDAEVAEVIGDLVDKSLVALHADDGPIQFRLLDVTRTYARVKLAASEEASRVQKRHALFHMRELKSEPIDKRLAWLASSLPWETSYGLRLP